MLSETYYAQNYADIIGLGLTVVKMHFIIHVKRKLCMQAMDMASP